MISDNEYMLYAVLYAVYALLLAFTDEIILSGLMIGSAWSNIVGLYDRIYLFQMDFENFRTEVRKMVGTDLALETKYITADLVKKSPTKRLVCLGDGQYEDVTYNEETTKRLTIPVQIDGKDKIWRPNKDSVINMRNEFGTDSIDWIGKPVALKVITIQGKESVIAIGASTLPLKEQKV